MINSHSRGGCCNEKWSKKSIYVFLDSLGFSIPWQNFKNSPAAYLLVWAIKKERTIPLALDNSSLSNKYARTEIGISCLNLTI